jgi:hypothetical protein
MATPILPLYEAMTAASSALTAAQQKYDQARAALLAAMPEHVEFATSPDVPVIIKRVGSEVVAVNHPYIGQPYEASP